MLTIKTYTPNKIDWNMMYEYGNKDGINPSMDGLAKICKILAITPERKYLNADI